MSKTIVGYTPTVSALPHLPLYGYVGEAYTVGLNPESPQYDMVDPVWLITYRDGTQDQIRSRTVSFTATDPGAVTIHLTGIVDGEPFEEYGSVMFVLSDDSVSLAYLEVEADPSNRPEDSENNPNFDTVSWAGVAVLFDTSYSAFISGRGAYLDFGDGTNRKVEIPGIYEHIYAEPGEYVATLVLRSLSGLERTDTAKIEVRQKVEIPLPVAVHNGPYKGITGEPVLFSAKGSHMPHPDYYVTRLWWDFVPTPMSGSQPLESVERWVFQTTFDTPWTGTVVLNVQSDSGLTSTAAQVEIAAADTTPEWMKDGVTNNYEVMLDIPYTLAQPQITFGSLKNRGFGTNDFNEACRRRALFDAGSEKGYSDSYWVEAQAIAESYTDANGDANFLRYGRRITKAEFQGPEHQSIGGGPQFFQSGPATFVGRESGNAADGTVYAGHWCVSPYHVLRKAMNGSDMLVTTNGSSYLESNAWCLIYSDPNYADAEFVQLGTVDKNATQPTITLKKRAHKSSAVEHGVGSRIAMLTLAQGQQAGSELWLRNMNRYGPKDANGNTWPMAIAAWIINNYDQTGARPTKLLAEIHELTDDSDWNVASDRGDLVPMKQISCTNSAAQVGPDYGFSNGRNVWQDGVVQAWSIVSEALPNLTMCGGDAKVMLPWKVRTGGHEYEAMMCGTYSGSTPPKPHLTQWFYQHLKASASGPTGPCTTFPFTKSTMERIPWIKGVNMAAAAMVGGMAGFINDEDQFPWPDWGSVYTSGAYYGHCVPRDNYPALMNNKHWMGPALGPAQRLIDPADFALDKAINLEATDLSGVAATWRTNGTDVRIEADGVWVTPTAFDARNVAAANAVTSPVSLAAGVDYTIVLAVESPEVRRASFSIGTERGWTGLMLTEGINHIVYSWRQTANTNGGLSIKVGQGDTPICIKQYLVFASYAGVITREFERGLAVLKLDSGTPRSVTLPRPWQFLYDGGPNQGVVTDKISFGDTPEGLLLIRPQQ